MAARYGCRWSFFDAFITEIVVPAVDTSSKGTADLVVRIQPGRLNTRMTPARLETKDVMKYGQPSSPPWNSGKFKLSIDGLERDCAAIQKIDRFVIKQGTKQLAIGDRREPVTELTSLEEPSLALALPSVSAGGFRDWFSAIVAGTIRPGQGSLQYWAPGSNRPLFDFRLSGVLPVSLAEGSGPRSLATVELSLDQMTLEGAM